MATMRDKAIAKSDELFPDYGDGASHGLSGDFIDGAVWADQAPAGDLEAEIFRRFPSPNDVVEELVTERWRRGFRLGAVWVREDSKPAASKADPTATLPQLYLGFIFNPPRTEGIEGEAVVHSDLESLRAILAAAVDEANLDEYEETDAFSWQDDDTVYWPDENLRYGSFAWAKIQPAIPGFRLRVSEFN